MVQGQLPGYVFQAAPGTYTPVAGGTPIVLTYNGATNFDDGITTPAAAVPIGFTFTYNGTAYTSIRPCANGFAAFGTAALANNTDNWTNSLAGGVPAQRPVIAPLWDDLDLSAGTVTYALTGTAPSRVLTIEWAGARWDYGAGGAVISFQVKLYETTNIIEFVYRQESTPVTNVSGTLGASIGITTAATGNNTFLALSDAGTSPTVSSTVENSTIVTKPATGQVYRWIPYCTAGANNTTATGEKISNVTFGSINNNSTSTAGYENFSGVSSFTVQGAPAPISISVSNPKATDQAYVWIDFNHNGSFTDPGELVYTSPVAAGPYTASVSVPALSATVLQGLTRMRVRVQDTNVQPTNNTSCGNSEWGQVEDYTLDINTCVAATFTTQPANALVCNGGSASITASASGTFLTYQWQVSTNGGASFTSISNGGVYSGATTNTLTIVGITNAMSGYLYRLVVNGYCSAANTTSGTAVLTVNNPTTFTQQPVAGKAVCAGSATSFSVAASGNGPTYQWQVSTDGGINFTNITGATSATLPLGNATIDMNGNRYRAVATIASCGSVISGQGLLTVNPLPVVTIQAAPTTAVQPGLSTFITVGSTPKAVSYVWSLNGNAIPGVTTGSFNPNYTGLGTYQVAVTDINGCQNTSARITIEGNETGQLFIFPNPNQGNFHVRYYGPWLAKSITIYNAASAKVYYKKYTNVTRYVQEDMALPNLPHGFYVLHIEYLYIGGGINGSFIIQ